MIEEALRYDVKGRKYIGTETKYYFADVGIRAAILNYRQQEETHIMENIIYNELRSRGYNVDVGLVELGGKDKNGKFVRKTVGGRLCGEPPSIQSVYPVGFPHAYARKGTARTSPIIVNQ